MTTDTCKAALSIAGEHYPCQTPAPHDGWAHTNVEAGAVWCSDRDPLPGMAASS